MKVTSFEISKKLAEIGFKAEPDYMWRFSYSTDKPICHPVYFGSLDREIISVPCFILETILDALPDSIPNNIDDIYGDELLLHISKKVIGYGAPHIYCGHLLNRFFFGIKEEGKETIFVDEYNNQSMVDCAARLLIELIQEKIIQI